MITVGYLLTSGSGDVYLFETYLTGLHLGSKVFAYYFLRIVANGDAGRTTLLPVEIQYLDDSLLGCTSYSLRL
jgi:hypothetical protein